MDRVIELLERIAIALEAQANKKPRRENPTEPGAEKLAILWNQFAHQTLPRVDGLNSKSTRHKNAAARWKEKPDENYWVAVLRLLNDSRFCLGDNQRAWRADFEFFVRPDTHHKLREGKYMGKDSTTMLKKTPNRVIVSHLPDGTPVYDTIKPQ